tara:strand:- start:38767 stop:38886 length:120 start_codon:yes stop_codon:yes gene_type:complete
MLLPDYLCNTLNKKVILADKYHYLSQNKIGILRENKIQT